MMVLKLQFEYSYRHDCSAAHTQVSHLLRSATARYQVKGTKILVDVRSKFS